SFPGRPLDWIILNAAVNSTANLLTKDDKSLPVGNSTEGALLLWLDAGAWLKDGRIDYREIRLRFPSVYQIHFSSERKRMTTVAQVNGRLVALVKGAAEWLLDASTHYHSTAGAVKLWTPAARESVQAQMRDATSQAMRTLALGYKLLP